MKSDEANGRLTITPKEARQLLWITDKLCIVTVPDYGALHSGLNKLKLIADSEEAPIACPVCKWVEAHSPLCRHNPNPLT